MLKPNPHQALEVCIQTIFDANDANYGYRRIHLDLKNKGWHYQHQKWVTTLKKSNLFQSMSRKGNCLDNAPMETFFGLLKQEITHGEPLCSFAELKRKIEAYIYYYNTKRIKQKLAGMSPVDYRIHTHQSTA